MVIGNENVFEIGSGRALFVVNQPNLSNDSTRVLVVNALHIGNSNVFGVRCKIGPETIVTNGCFIGARCSAVLKEKLPERTVIYGEKNCRRIASQLVEVKSFQYFLSVLFRKS